MYVELADFETPQCQGVSARSFRQSLFAELAT